MRTRQQLPTLIALLLAISTTGCGKVREISACRTVASEVNATLAEIEALSKTPAPDMDARIAKRYAELARSLKPRGEGSSTLAVAIREYASIIAATDGALRGRAEAQRSGNNSKLAESRRELERLVKRERAAVARIDADCHS